MRNVLLGLLIMVGLSGCAHFGTELAQVNKALAGDAATVVVNLGLTTPWGSQTVKMTRIGGQTNSVTVSPEGVVQINPAH